ncbi:MAG: trigger factor [Deltaproteobacteria bacterium]|nr:trigger factor [Deltaproteobacteria bacterium]MBW2016782.1 trigger factor [Deltaproteobacteria bacterium]MBW2128466.1 trigger factor [Deltaproteobacteria bacterium]MBW2303480.1 trigger factor [Deltaproteobacteria bacterium]
MKATVEDITGVKKRLIVEIDSSEIDQRINEAYRTLAKRAKIPGFRPGKAPRKILESYYGPQLLEDLARDLVTETLPAAVQETETFPLSYPVIEKGNLKAGCEFRYTAVMEVKPQFELKDYMGLEVEKEIPRVTDEEVSKYLEEIRTAHGNLMPVEEDRGIREGDFAVIDYKAFEGGAPLEDVKAENFPLEVGSHKFHPDFERQLLGLKKGEEARFTVSFEEDFFHQKLAGKTVEFQVRVADIKLVELPDLNDEFAKNLGSEFQSLDDLREKIREDLEAREKKRVEQELKTRLLGKISATVDFELPESLVESELNRAVENVRQNLIRSGSDLEKAGISVQKMRDDLRPASEQRVKNMLILGEIARQNDITIGEEELNEGFRDLAVNLGQDPQVVRRYYEANQAVESFRERLLEEKTLNYLVSGAKIIEVEAEKLKSSEPEEVQMGVK